MRIVIFAFIASFVFIGQAQSKTCRGNDRLFGASASVQFLASKKARYCFQNKCFVANYTGDKNKNYTTKAGRLIIKGQKKSYGYLLYFQTGGGNVYVRAKC